MKRPAPLERRRPGRPKRGDEMPDRDCEQCGATFHPGSATQRLCSRDCAHEAQRRPVELTCPVCEVVFTRPESQIRWRGGRWCSRKCMAIGRAAKRPARTCAECGESFVPGKDNGYATRQFCSQRCMGIASRREVVKPCATCGRPVARQPSQSRTRKVYCDRICQGAARMRPDSEASRGPGWRKLAAEIRRRDGYCCVRCGGTDAGRALSVDHIIPWRWLKHVPELANSPTNLASLCVSCHGYKTSHVEPRLANGDVVSLRDFYGVDRAGAALALWGDAPSAERRAAAGLTPKGQAHGT